MSILSIVLNTGQQNDMQSYFQIHMPVSGNFEQGNLNILSRAQDQVTCT